MADEKPATPDAGEAEYRRELNERVRGAAQDMGVSTEEKPAEGEEKPEGEPEEPQEDGEEAEPEAEGEEGAEEEPDEKGKYSKAFRKLQTQEAELQQFKTQILAQEREIKVREEKAKRDEGEIASFVKSLRADPYGTLLKAGLLNEDDAEFISKQLYYHSKAAQADPKNKAEADRIRRERQFALEAEENRNRIARLEREREEERHETKRQAELNNYVAQIDATVANYKSKTPVLAKALERNPERTNRELLQIANDLSVAKGAFADPTLVVLAWTKQRKALLAELGNAAEAPKQEQVKSKTAVEKKGPPNGKTAIPAQSAEDSEAAYQRELKARLNGTWEGD